MKLDVFKWEEIDATKEHNIRSGRLLLNLSAPALCYVTCEGYEVLAGPPAASFNVSVAEPCSFRLEGPKGLRAFREAPEPRSVASQGERFTNADRMPLESGSVAEVKRALRMFHLERNAMLADMRAETAALEARRDAARQSPENPPPAPPDAPADDPEGTDA